MRALVFDVDGTMADTEAVHREAFNAAFAEAGLDWHWDEALYARLLKVAGGKERIRNYWHCVEPEEAAGCEGKDVVDAIHAIKTRCYTERVRGGGVPLRPGIRRLIDEGHAAGMPLAIATTTTPANVDALLSTPLGVDWRKQFAAVCDASTVSVKKPAPDVYTAVLRQLGMPAADCLALEDSEIGLRAARAAGIPVVVTPTAHTASQDFDGALLVLPHLGDPGVPVLQIGAGSARNWVDLELLRHIHRQQGVQ